MEIEEALNIPFESELLYIDDEGDLVIDDRLLPYATNQHTGLWDEETVRKCEANDGTMVTVVCITYNHEDYIAEALQSFVDQETDFKFKVFVGDDASEDTTPSIIQSFADKYPDVIVPFCREENLGGMGKHNLIDLCQRATSPYIAFCEGDDYWIDPKKLQKQFDFMQENLEFRACFTRTIVEAPEDWHLRTWYKADTDGNIILPDSHPLFINQTDYSPEYIVTRHDAHTSTHFFRWDYALIIPSWYYKGMIGDTPLVLLQLGNSNLKILPDITSCYRINRNSVFYANSHDSHFLNTRLAYLDYLEGMRAYALEHFDNYSVIPIENRIKKETANYLDVLVRVKDRERIGNFFKDYPTSIIALDAYLSFYRDSRNLTESLSWNGYKFMVRNNRNRKRIAKLKDRLWERQKALIGIKRSKNTLQRRASIFQYWVNVNHKPKEGLWVFSGFNGRTYGDNTKYLFEHIQRYHPEINAIWLTDSEDVFNDLETRGLSVLMKNSRQAQRAMLDAEVAVIDHFIMSDYGRPRPLNPNTAILQLWHGVGLKSMDDLGLTTVKGVRYLDEFDAVATDSLLTKARKYISRLKEYPKSEQCETYTMMVVPGQEMQKAYENGFHLNSNRFFVAGYPRMDRMLTNPNNGGSLPLGRKILFAPTYRWSQYEEMQFIDEMVNALPALNSLTEELDATISIRLHPHTWRSYGQQISYAITKLDNIEINEDVDIYETLDSYAVLITDYSSIAYDYLLLDRPIIFFCPDLEWYLAHENKLKYDYETYTPGKKAHSWNEVGRHLKDYFANPSLDHDFRLSIRDFFYDSVALTGDSCEMITKEMKRRLNEKTNRGGR